MNSNDLQNLKQQLHDIDDKITPLEEEKYKINKEYIKLLQEECKKNIGRCFKRIKEGKVIAYCKIISIDNTYTTMTNDIHFNEYQYPAIWFHYPYCTPDLQNGDEYVPFTHENLFSGAWGKGNDFVDELNNVFYQEITNEEYMEKFIEINSQWIKEISEVK